MKTMTTVDMLESNFRQFVKFNCKVGEGQSVQAKTLQLAFKKLERNSEIDAGLSTGNSRFVTPRLIGKLASKLGFSRKRNRHGIVYIGVGLNVQ